MTDRSGRTIGRLIGRQYYKLITRPDQILRSPPGFGFDVWAMDFYVLPRVDLLVVEDKVHGRVYRSSAQNFVEHRMEINRGAGPQYVLPLAYWETEGGTVTQSAPAQNVPDRQTDPATAPPSPHQDRLL